MADQEQLLLSAQLDNQRRKVDIDNFDITVRELVRMVSAGELVIAPEYQRKFRWQAERESKLIESLFLGLPVPAIFVATNKDGTWELIDGLQRVSTIAHFLGADIDGDGDLLAKINKAGPLKLEGLKELNLFNDKLYSELPIAAQLGFSKRALRVTALSDKADPNVRYDIFERLNTGGVVLTPQEIRACVYRGKFADFIDELARDENFKSLLKLQEKKSNDGTSEELVLKFFAYLEDRANFKGDVTEFLNSYMEKQSGGPSIKKQRVLFKAAAKSLFDVMGGPILRRNVNVTPINLAEAALVAAAELVAAKAPLNPQQEWTNDRELVRMSTKGTNTRNYLEGRIARARELLEGANVIL